MTKTGNPKSNDIPYLPIIITLVLVVIGVGFLYIQKSSAYSQEINSYGSLNSNYTSFKTQSQNAYNRLNSSLSNLQKNYDTMKNMTTAPFIEELAINKSVTVPQSNFSIPFYNSNYNLYNNYTINGDYFINFTAPYDGYMLLYLYSSTGENGTYSFEMNSNTSRLFYPTGFRPIQYCVNPYGYTCSSTIQAISGYEEVPNTTDALYIMPILRGEASFVIQNSNNHAINVTFSLLYIGEYFANTPIDTTYTGSHEMPQHFNNSTR
jgi:hypothetical protein